MVCMKFEYVSKPVYLNVIELKFSNERGKNLTCQNNGTVNHLRSVWGFADSTSERFNNLRSIPQVGLCESRQILGTVRQVHFGDILIHKCGVWRDKLWKVE